VQTSSNVRRITLKVPVKTFCRGLFPVLSTQSGKYVFMFYVRNLEMR